MTKLPLLFNLEGNLVTEQGDILEPHFQNATEAKAFCEKYKGLYEFRGVQYSLNHTEQEENFRTS